MLMGSPKQLQTIFILLTLTSTAYSHQFALYGSDGADLEPFFNSLTYLVVYAFLWNFLIEVSLIIVLHFKQTPAYIANHSFINLCIVTGQLINNAVLANGEGISHPFFIIEGVLTFVELGQIMLGNWLNRKLVSEDLVKKIFILRFLHRYSGRAIYLTRKYQLMAYAYLFFKNQNMALPAIAIAPVFIVTLLTHALAYIVLRKSVFTDAAPRPSYLIQTSPEKKEVYLDLLKSIEQGEVHADSSGNSLIDVENNTGVQLMKAAIRWVIIEDKVFDVTDFRHPKGNYILKGIERKDVTKEMFGFKSYRFESNSRRFSKVLKHKHVPRTLTHLMNYCIGPLSICPLICSTSGNTDTLEEDSAMTFQLNNIMKQEGDRIGSTKEKYWQSESLYKISDQGSVIYAQKVERDHLVNLSVYWLYTFGKYFVVTFDNGRKDFMYALLSFIPIYVHKKFEYYQKLNLDLVTEIKLPSSAVHGDLKDLHNVMLQGLDRDQRQALETSSEIRSCHLPLYWQSNMNSKKLKDTSFQLLGPIGMGLGFDGSCSSKVLLIAKDEGILPFVDFFEFLSQKALIELTGVSHPVFTNEYLYAYSNEPEFSLYWEISDEYWPTAEALALSSLHTLNITYRRDSTNKVKKLVKLITISSMLTVSQNNIVLTVTNDNRDFNDIQRLNGDKKFENYVLAGSDAFVNHILATSTVPSGIITIL